MGLLTNDQGRNLVDTALLRSQGFATEEIPGGSFSEKIFYFYATQCTGGVRQGISDIEDHTRSFGAFPSRQAHSHPPLSDRQVTIGNRAVNAYLRPKSPGANTPDSLGAPCRPA